ncbi:hypothetical protein GKZ89_12695 [Bacillus mangrovi]|uniref:Uncharacterized protein n=1 Tax=Metabacillus mangrovi TaxID=1491830 RepID=A0A7X2S6E2_9BACI|nr:hypothetical protein [Metabacillus mangrovi]MTH54262.1 hypothetical protein [Metabacillus mangrovi]
MTEGSKQWICIILMLTITIVGFSTATYEMKTLVPVVCLIAAIVVRFSPKKSDQD